jgi:hypothetical protein
MGAKKYEESGLGEGAQTNPTRAGLGASRFKPHVQWKIGLSGMK